MIQIRTPSQVGVVAVLSLLAGAVFLAVQPLLCLRHLRNPLPAVRRAIKPAALWINAALYKASEEEIDYLLGTQKRLLQLQIIGGRDTGYYAKFRLRLSAKEYRERLLQRKLRARRDRINKW